MKYLNYYKDRTEIKSEMYDNKPFVTYVEKDNTVFYDKNSVKIPDSLKSKIRALWIADGKSNEDSDRNIIVDRSGNGHNLELSGFSFSKNSGYGKYSIAFKDFPYEEEIINISDSKVVFNSGGQLLLPYPSMNKDIPSFRIKVSGLSQTYHFRYYYRSSDGVQHSIDMAKDGYYDLPICYNIQNSSDGTNCGFANNGTDVVTIEQIPEYQGAVVTDGVDDIISSNNSIRSILGSSNKITVLSMIRQLDRGNQSIIRTNFIGMAGSNSDTWVNNLTSEIGTTGIYGYSVSDLNNSSPSIISNILGDDHLYTVDSKIDHSVMPNFTVNGFVRTGDHIDSVSSVAWYWTLIANDVLTKDEIELLISYYDLDRWIRPIAYYNPKRQGLTNDNHTEFNDKLLDLSGNGYDIKLNNMSWSLGSGIGKYSSHCDEWFWVSNGNDNNDNNANGYVTSTEVKIYGISSSIPIGGGIKDGCRLTRCLGNTESLPSMTIKVSGISKNNVKLSYDYCNDNSIKSIEIINDGIYNLPESVVTPSINNWMGLYLKDFLNNLFTNPIIIEIIPDNKDALVLDGIDDYGQFVGDLGLNDYTVVMDREYSYLINNQVPLVSSNISEDQTPFIIEHYNTDSNAISFSYGASHITDIPIDINRRIVYQSTYSYMGDPIPRGSKISTGNGITLGKYGNGVQYSAICLYSLMIFPYTLSKFLMNRQLEKYNLNKLI